MTAIRNSTNRGNPLNLGGSHKLDSLACHHQDLCPYTTQRQFGSAPPCRATPPVACRIARIESLEWRRQVSLRRWSPGHESSIRSGTHPDGSRHSALESLRLSVERNGRPVVAAERLPEPGHAASCCGVKHVLTNAVLGGARFRDEAAVWRWLAAHTGLKALGIARR